jgi:uncharacterized protein with ParB-like and HNH nuclease domain
MSIMSEQAKPLISTQTTSSLESVRTVLQDLGTGSIAIPDYQRDFDQWDVSMESLFIESVLNNLTVPAFFLAPTESDPAKLEIVDGQQRLITLSDFYNHSLRLVSADDAAYLGSSVRYEGKTFSELAGAYKQAFLTA